MVVDPAARFGRWTVVREAHSADGGQRVHCRCDCGNRANLVVADLVRGEVPACELCAKSDVANAARPTSPPPPPSENPKTRPEPPPRRGRISVPSVKVTLPLRPDQLPRDVLPREGAPAVSIELTIEVEAGDGNRPLAVRATFSSRNYRRAVKAIDELVGNATALIQGRLTGNGELLDAGISVQPKAPAATGSPAGPEVCAS